MSLFYRFTSFLFKSFFWLFYRNKVYGINNIPKGSAIIAPNHVSYWDPPIIGGSCPEELTYLAKKELFETPGLSWFIRQLNAYPVNGTAGDISSLKLILHLLEEGKKVVIFPEGERTSNGELTTIKPGIGLLALKSHAPIVPVYIAGNYEIWPIHQKYPKLSGRTAVIFGKPIYIEEFASYSKKEAHDAVAKRVYDALSKLRDWYRNGAIGDLP